MVRKESKPRVMHREIKAELAEILENAGWEERLTEILVWPPRRVVGPLFSLLLHKEVLVRWHAVTALGMAVSRLADERMEEARVVMRRIMWNLSEESGNLGWGMPETMGEVLAAHEGLAGEYHRILLSYIHDPSLEGNYIDHTPLRRGAHWGIGRLAQARPELAAPAASDLARALTEEDAACRGLSAWTLGMLPGAGDTPGVKPGLAALLDDDGELVLYRDRLLAVVKVSDLAREALSSLGIGVGR